ncbi:unnamed protein product [Prunus brigantina]
MLIFTLFEDNKITNGDFWLDPEIVVMENIFHLFPSRPFSSSGFRLHPLLNHSLQCPHVIQSTGRVRISSLFWLDVVNPVLHSVWPRQNFIPVFFLFFKIWMIPPVCPWYVPIIVGKWINSSSASCW